MTIMTIIMIMINMTIMVLSASIKIQTGDRLNLEGVTDTLILRVKKNLQAVIESIK